MHCVYFADLSSFAQNAINTINTINNGLFRRSHNCCRSLCGFDSVSKRGSNGEQAKLLTDWVISFVALLECAPGKSTRREIHWTQIKLLAFCLFWPANYKVSNQVINTQANTFQSASSRNWVTQFERFDVSPHSILFFRWICLSFFKILVVSLASLSSL